MLFWAKYVFKLEFLYGRSLWDLVLDMLIFNNFHMYVKVKATEYIKFILEINILIITIRKP